MEFRNQSDKQFTDISSEEYRTYRFALVQPVFVDKEVGWITTNDVTINQPLQLSVSENGHRIFDASGSCHYIPSGWIHLEWKVKEGQPHFVK